MTLIVGRRLRRSRRPTIAALIAAAVITMPVASARSGPLEFPQQTMPASDVSQQAIVATDIATPVGVPIQDKMGTGVSPTQPAMNSKGMTGSEGCCGAMGGKSDLPGFPGASHIYHVGATGFFLDYAEAIELTANQQTALDRIKARSLGDLAAAQRNIDQGEQELWMLTSSDRPDATALEAKIREIEKLEGDRRIAFIRSVGEAARVLTDDQRVGLLATSSPEPTQATAPQGAMAPAGPQKGMGDDSMGNRGGGAPGTKSKNGGMGDM